MFLRYTNQGKRMKELISKGYIVIATITDGKNDSFNRLVLPVHVC